MDLIAICEGLKGPEVYLIAICEGFKGLEVDLIAICEGFKGPNGDLIAICESGHDVHAKAPSALWTRCAPERSECSHSILL